MDIFTQIMPFSGTASIVCKCQLWKMYIAFPFLVSYINPVTVSASPLPVAYGILQV